MEPVSYPSTAPAVSCCLSGSLALLLPLADTHLWHLGKHDALSGQKHLGLTWPVMTRTSSSPGLPTSTCKVKLLPAECTMESQCVGTEWRAVLLKHSHTHHWSCKWYTQARAADLISNKVWVKSSWKHRGLAMEWWEPRHPAFPCLAVLSLRNECSC